MMRMINCAHGMPIASLQNDFADNKLSNKQDLPASFEAVSPSGRKRLNDLDGKQWVKSTKSVWLETDDRENMQTVEDALETGLLLSESPPRDHLKKNHPATFSENDIAKLVRFFTKSGEKVCDPFLGSGSSAIASIGEGRNFIGVELYPVWLSLAKQRIAQTSNPYCVDSDLRCGDSLEVMRALDNESIDFIVTSPPYWGILDKIDHKAKGERLSKGLATDYGNNQSDLASVKSYSDFIGIMTRHLKEYHRVLRSKQYAAIIVSDFRHGKEYFLFHADIASAMKQAGFMIQGLITLVQDNKKLYPYGYPSAYVPNISNQFIIIGRKL